MKGGSEANTTSWKRFDAKRKTSTLTMKIKLDTHRRVLDATAFSSGIHDGKGRRSRRYEQLEPCGAAADSQNTVTSMVEERSSTSSRSNTAVAASLGAKY